MRFVSEGVEIVGTLGNVSKAGMFVTASDLPRISARIALEFRMPAGLVVNVTGEVRWTTADQSRPDLPSGFGVLVREIPREYVEFFRWASEQDEKPDQTPDETP